MLYEVAIIEEPTKKEVEEGGAQERLVLAPVPVVARDPQGAVLAVMVSSNAPKLDLSRARVLVRPFA